MVNIRVIFLLILIYKTTPSEEKGKKNRLRPGECAARSRYVYTSWCVRKIRGLSCDLSLSKKVLTREQNSVCGKKQYCCTYRHKLPPPAQGVCGLSYFSDDDYRIIAGLVSQPGQWPWVVSIESNRNSYDEWSHICGGVILTNQIILTAAHCFRAEADLKSYRVILGQHDKGKQEKYNKIVHIQNLIMHERFQKPVSGSNDIALLLLEEPFKFTKYIQPICLPTYVHTFKHNRDMDCFILGFGLIDRKTLKESKVLRHAQVDLYKHKKCRASYRVRYKKKQNLCAGRRKVNDRNENADACQGDSGGPLVCLDPYSDWTLVGLVSFGTGCGEARKPGIYTLVHAYLKWIKTKQNRLEAFIKWNHSQPPQTSTE